MGCQEWLELRHETQTEADWLRHGARGLLRAEAGADLAVLAGCGTAGRLY
jgi:hypothetical protein